MKMGNSGFRSHVKEEPLRWTITTSETDFLVLTVMKTSAWCLAAVKQANQVFKIAYW